MNTKVTIMPWILALSLLLLGGCGNEKKVNETDTATRVWPEYLEPDNYFKKATEYFEKGNKELTLEEISNAHDFIKTIIIEGDSTHSDIIEFALGELEDLSEYISYDSITSSTQLMDVFSSVDLSIGRYHIDIIENSIKNEKNDQRSLMRMHRALLRIEYALKRNEVELTEAEELELITAKENIVGAEKASPSLWKKIKVILEEYERRLDDNSNLLDETN